MNIFLYVIKSLVFVMETCFQRCMNCNSEKYLDEFQALNGYRSTQTQIKLSSDILTHNHDSKRNIYKGGRIHDLPIMRMFQARTRPEGSETICSGSSQHSPCYVPSVILSVKKKTLPPPQNASVTKTCICVQSKALPCPFQAPHVKCVP
jgi:hypothetical protein